MLNKLGDDLTNAQILYSSNEDLEKILNENAQKSLKAGLSSNKINKLETNNEKFEKGVRDMEGKIRLTRFPLLGKTPASFKAVQMQRGC